jgi:hypothetical protein
MSTHTNNITVRASAALTDAGDTSYGDSVRVDHYDELNLFLQLTAQSTYASGDTLTVSVQTKDPVGNWYDLTGASFTAITTDAAATSEDIGIVVFGSNIRLKYVTTAAGATVSYTFSVTAIGKGSF